MKLKRNEKVSVIKAPLFRKSKSKSPPRNNYFEGKKTNNDLMRSPIRSPIRSPSDEAKKYDFKTKMIERGKALDQEAKEKENKVNFVCTIHLK